ncbi:hypothetical protein JCM9279_003767 [Rhodotorula babjevae]
MASATAAASLRLSSVSASTALGAGTSSSSSEGEFITFKATMRLPISPRFAASNHSASYPGHDQGMDGVREVLAGWVMRYLPPVRAVLLSFSPTPRFLHPAASFPASASPFDSSYSPAKDPRSLLSTPQPEAAAQDDDDDGETVRFKSLPMVQGTGFTLANVEWEGVGWRPRVGMKLVGTLTLASPSHVSLLLHNLFNASIPSSHIPTGDYEFDPECAVPPIVLERRNANVPLRSVVDSVKRRAGAAAAAGGEAGEGAVEETVSGEADGEHLVPQSAAGEADVAKAEADAEKEQDEADEVKEDEDEALHAERGWWVHRTTHEPLGGADGRIEFTLVDLTTSNSLLSCTGSLLADPFSPAALAALSAHHPSLSAKPDPDASLVKSKVLTTRDNKRKRGRDSESDTGSSGSDSDDDDDRESSASPAPRGGAADASDSSDSDLDNDDDDGVGTGIPRHGVDAAQASQRAQHGGKAVVPTVERVQSVASSRSPSPLPAPAHLASSSSSLKKDKKSVKVKDEVDEAAAAAKAAKKAAKKDKKAGKESKEGRKSKKVKAER